MIKSWRRGLNLLGLRQVTYQKQRHFHGLVFRKPGKIIQELTIKDTKENCDIEETDITKLFFIPQDEVGEHDKDTNDEMIHHDLDRDCIISDFQELPSLDL